MSSKDHVGESQPPAAVVVRLIPSHSNVTLIRSSSYFSRSHSIIRALTTDPCSKERWHPSSRPERKPGPMKFRPGGKVYSGAILVIHQSISPSSSPFFVIALSTLE